MPKRTRDTKTVGTASKGRPGKKGKTPPSPSSKPKRRRNRERTFEDLKRSALERFVKDGVDETSIEEITEPLGLTRATFYFYFENKQAVIRALLADANADLERRFRAIFTGPVRLEFPDLLRSLADSILDFYEEQRPFIEVLSRGAQEMLDLSVARQGVSTGLTGMIAAILDGYARQRGKPLPEAPIVAAGLQAMWLRICLHYLHETDQGRSKAARTQARETLARASWGVLRALTDESY